MKAKILPSAVAVLLLVALAVSSCNTYKGAKPHGGKRCNCPRFSLSAVE